MGLGEIASAGVGLDHSPYIGLAWMTYLLQLVALAGAGTSLYAFGHTIDQIQARPKDAQAGSGLADGRNVCEGAG